MDERIRQGKEVSEEGMDARAREDVHLERYNRNLLRNRRGHGASHSAPQGRASQIKASGDSAGGTLVARCIIRAIALVRSL
jgi:hypothetical protein